MKMPTTQSSENGLYDYESNSYSADNLDNIVNEDYNTPAEDFSEYLWMENEEEFDKEVMQRLEEEALMEQCMEAMLADEIENHTVSVSSNEVSNLVNNLKLDSTEVVKVSNLNPLAAEFVPGVRPTVQQAVGASS